jgi:hypothetical protein
MTRIALACGKVLCLIHCWHLVYLTVCSGVISAVDLAARDTWGDDS